MGREEQRSAPGEEATTLLGQDPEKVELASVAELATYFVWRSGPSLYGVPGPTVEFVAQPVVPTPVPTSPSLLLGIAHLRGRFVTIVDLEAALALPARTGRGEADRLVAIKVGENSFGFTVDHILGLVEVEVESIQVAGAEGAITLTSEFASHQFEVEQETVVTLDLDRLLLRLVGNTAIEVARG